MMSTRRYDGSEQGSERQETIAGFLTSALNMEDQISGGVYEDYMRPENWPGGLSDGVFAQIKSRLTTLIRDTKRHQEILQRLNKVNGHDERPE